MLIYIGVTYQLHLDVGVESRDVEERWSWRWNEVDDFLEGQRRGRTNLDFALFVRYVALTSLKLAHYTEGEVLLGN